MSEFRIKRGATFYCELLMDDPEEWDAFAHDRVRGAVKQGEQVYPVTVVADSVLRAVTFTASTDAWALGRAVFDIWLDLDGRRTALPYETNVLLSVFEGAAA